jgi:hypothetical protein
MTRSSGVSGFVATLILVTITLSLSVVVYEGVSGIAQPRQVVFSNRTTVIGGSPEIVEYTVNSSSPVTPVAFEADDASSPSGILYLDGTHYGATQRLCLANAITFFSVFTATNGTLQAVSNGQVWMDGYVGTSLRVAAGWHEVMFTGSSSCGLTMPDGTAVTYPGSDVSTVPFIGAARSEGLSLYVPTDGSSHSLVVVFDGGQDRLA